jgi:hypothetical protein
MKLHRHFLEALLAATALWSTSATAADPPKTSEPGSIEYATVDEALKALHAKKGVTFRNQNGWLVAEDSVALTTWLFTPSDHPAYPSMVRRRIINKADGAYMDTQIRCLASQETCDKFFGGK